MAGVLARRLVGPTAVLTKSEKLDAELGVHLPRVYVVDDDAAFEQAFDAG
jgi:hypothetical protein